MAALRVLARKLAVPAASASLRRASAPCVSPVAGCSRLLGSRSIDQTGKAKRKVKATRNTSFRRMMRDLDELDKLTRRSAEEAIQANRELSRAIANLPRNLALAIFLGICIPAKILAYILGRALHRA